MPNPTRPSVYPDWALTGTRSNPGGPATNTGFLPEFIPPAEWHNFLFGYMGDWVRWLDFANQTNLARNEYDATVGTNGTHATINALMADPGIANIYRVLVTTPQTLTSTQVINKSDIQLVFKPSAVYSKGSGLVKGISITAPRVRITGGRFTDWATAGDKAIQLEVGANNCIIVEAMGNNNATFVNDLGANNTLVAVIEEV